MPFPTKLVNALAKGETTLFAVAPALPHDMKAGLLADLESDTNQAAWRTVKHLAGNQFASHPASFLVYLGVLAAESEYKQSRAALMEEGPADIRSLKCAILGCNQRELSALEKYLREHPSTALSLIGVYRKQAARLRTTMPFSLLLD